jgi:hypothetical protein
MFSFETNVGTGKGMIRLVCLPNGAWMAHMIYTALQELHSAKEIAGYNRPHGGNNSLKGGAVEGNWYERRERKKDFLDEQPGCQVAVAGAFGVDRREDRASRRFLEASLSHSGDPRSRPVHPHGLHEVPR